MQTELKKDERAEMSELARELFSVIPGIERAISVPVHQAESLTEDIFTNEQVAMNSPCLIKGAVKNWPASKKWRDKEYWFATCENVPRQVVTHMNYYSWDRKKDSEKMPFHDAIERLFEGRDHIFSIPSQVVNETNLYRGVIKDLPGFSFLVNKRPPLWDDPRGLFIYRRAATAWHVHNCDETLMCQIKGTKKVALLPPTMPGAKDITSFLETESYLEGKTLDKSLDLKVRIVTVEEGDSLYIPPHWFHCVVPIDGELGFTFLTVFRSPWHVYGDFSKFFVRRLYKHALKNAGIGFKLIIPFLACYAGLSHYYRKLTVRKNGQH